VSDQDDGDPVALRQIHQAKGRLADLADAPGRALQLIDRRGLDRIDHDERRSLRARNFHDPADIVFRQDTNAVARGPASRPRARRT
jgi:hypothetical protein